MYDRASWGLISRISYRQEKESICVLLGVLQAIGALAMLPAWPRESTQAFGLTLLFQDGAPVIPHLENSFHFSYQADVCRSLPAPCLALPRGLLIFCKHSSRSAPPAYTDQQKQPSPQGRDMKTSYMSHHCADEQTTALGCRVSGIHMLRCLSLRAQDNDRVVRADGR